MTRLVEVTDTGYVRPGDIQVAHVGSAPGSGGGWCIQIHLINAEKPVHGTVWQSYEDAKADFEAFIKRVNEKPKKKKKRAVQQELDGVLETHVPVAQR